MDTVHGLPPNSAFLLANVAMPINSAYAVHNACPLCFLLMHTTINQEYDW